MDKRSAVLSPCGIYRYRLERTVAEVGKTFAYFGVNPSTADALINDATVRKLIGFTTLNKGKNFLVGNVFAYRATDVNDLDGVGDCVGPDNAAHLMQIANDADVLIPCWGNTTKVVKRLREKFVQTERLLRDTGKPVYSFGFTNSGCPKHPLMLGYNTPLIEWKNL